MTCRNKTVSVRVCLCVFVCVCVWAPWHKRGTRKLWGISTAPPIVFPIFHTCCWKPSQWNTSWSSHSPGLFVHLSVKSFTTWIKGSTNKQGVLAIRRYCVKPAMGVNWLVTTPRFIPCQWATLQTGIYNEHIWCVKCSPSFFTTVGNSTLRREEISRLNWSKIAKKLRRTVEQADKIKQPVLFNACLDLCILE